MGFKGDLVLYDLIGTGGYSDVYTCDYKEEFCVCKKYSNKEILKSINLKMFKLKSFYGDKDIIFPKDFIYENKTDICFESIIFDYLYKYRDIIVLENEPIEKQIEVLKNTRDVIERLHNEYKIIHGDILTSNIMVNNNYDIKLIDLDTYQFANTSFDLNNNYVSVYAVNYINNFGFDYDLDIFLFNILCLSITNKWDFYFVIDNLRKFKPNYFNSKVSNQIINSYKDLNSQRSLKKEYIIDHM